MAPTTAADESTPLFGAELVPNKGGSGGATTLGGGTQKESPSPAAPPTGDGDDDRRVALFLFLEAKTPGGLKYETFTIFLIFLSVATFVLATLFLPEYNTDTSVSSKCDSHSWCDALWFGNHSDNALSVLGLGATSITEMFVVFVFTVDYLLRIYTADLIDPKKYAGFYGRIRFVPTFFSLVDLASTVPFYVDAFLLPETDIAASTFLRMFRLLRMMKVEGRYDLALGLIDDVLYAQRAVLGTALFVGMTVWGVLSSFFYLAERKNPDMIYCGAAPDRCFEHQDEVDTSLCTTDEWGIVDCSAAGCENHDDDDGEACWNLYRSIVDSSFWTLMNLFGEFALVDQHSAWGKVLGTFTAVFAVAVFALPVGVVASGFEDQIARRREQKASQAESVPPEGAEPEEEEVVVGDESTFRGRVYNLLHRQRSERAKSLKVFTNAFIIVCCMIFIFNTVEEIGGFWHDLIGKLQFFTYALFAVEYALKVYSAREDPKYSDGVGGIFCYFGSFVHVVDFMSIFPYWVGLVVVSDENAWPGLVLLIKICLFDRSRSSFGTFDGVLRENMDVLAVTGFSALLLWIFFSSVLYYTERDSLDEEMQLYYKTIPDAMWVTLLNLSGECPLAHYSNMGKVIIGIIGLFATAVFGIPIGILGAGFEELVESEYEDSPDEEADENPPTNGSSVGGFQQTCYEFVNGIGSKTATAFELSIYFLIAATVTIGIIQTVPGYEESLSWADSLAVGIFTIEYIIRFIGAGADPEFSCHNGLVARVKYLFSFYSIIDLLAIVPFYIARFMPSFNDDYFRMMRLFRLLKLDKYVPSISLVDDVFRLKKKVLMVACYAAVTLWLLYAAALYIVERNDQSIGIDPLPLYGCADEECYMSDRYNSYFNSIPLTGIHLTGDFPVIEYCGAARVILFFLVFVAVGVVSIPSGVIASGFAQIVQSKTKGTNRTQADGEAGAGDDWYDIKYRQLATVPTPSSVFGPGVDSLQMKAKEYLDGKVDEKTGLVSRTHFSSIGRHLFFSLIIANIVAVILESVPEIDKSIGNSAGNLFDVFESWSVFFFTIDYTLRLFSARKSREALYSPWVYTITFFGIVDLMSILPWYIQQFLARTGHLNGDEAKIFRIFRIFRVLQLEDFMVAFSKLDNVFRASKDVLKATGLMAIIIWVGSSALFFIFEQNNPNFRQCSGSIPLVGTDGEPGCYDFESTSACNEVYPDMCNQVVFTNMPNTMFFVAVFLGGDWGVVDFTWQGKLVCLFLCVAGIALYSIPVGTLFDSFGAVVGLSEEEDEENSDDKQSGDN